MADRNTKTPETNKNGTGKDKRFIYIGVIGILIVVILLLLLRSCGTDTPVNPTTSNKPTFDMSVDPNAQSGSLEGKTQEEIEEALNKQVADGSINISMSLNPIFEDGTSEGNLQIVNDKINKYPQVVEIYLNDTEELIYKSGAIPVGSRVDTGKLLVDLEPGDYKCTAYFNAVNPDTGELLGKAGADVKITVKK